ncbi:MAG: hypothetical protein O7D91_11470 [Planctomycetota bacterium]|nr:hypothetical protein [Planctomycetota bacterium]
MAKQIKRFGPIVLLVALIGVFVVIPLARSYPQGPPPMGDPHIAKTIRGAVGFGAVDVLPALAAGNGHSGMINTARAFVADHQAELDPLVENYDSAYADLTNAISWGEDPTAARQAVEDAGQAIVAGIVDLLPGLDDHVPPPFQALIERVLANAMLDPDLRALILTEDQRTAILAAQQERDNVTLDARNWYQTARNEEAEEAFETALQSILTPPQRNHLASFRQHLAARLDAMLIAEAEPFNEG